MTTKIVNVKTSEGTPAASPDLRAAYQAHTLVQMLYGQLALGQSWPIQPQYYTGPPHSYVPSPQPVVTPWTADERCGVAWMVPRWPH